VTTALTAIEDAHRLARRDPGRALALLRAAVSAQIRRVDPTITARASYLMAKLLSERGDYGTALTALNSARRDWLAADRGLEALRTDLGKATVLQELGHYREAIAVSTGLLDDLADWAERPGVHEEVSSVTARAHNNLGNAWSRLGEHRRALRHYDVAANLFRALGEGAMVARADANRGLTYLRVGMTHRGLEELRRAELLLTEQGRTLAAAKCRIDIAEGQLHLDEVEAAIATLAEVRGVLEGLAALPELGRLGLTLGSALLQVGLTAQARREAQAAADTFADLSMVDESGRATYVCALASLSAGEDAVALVELEAAARLFEDCEDAGYLARVRLAQAALAERRGDLARAAELAEAVVERFEALDEMVPATLARLLLARLSDDEAAAGHLAQAAGQVTTLGLAPLVPTLELERARRERAAGQIDEAVARLRALVQRPEPAGGFSGDMELRLAVRGARGQLLDELVALLVELGDTRSHAEAWQWSAAGRGRTLAAFAARAVRADSAAVAGGDLAPSEGARRRDEPVPVRVPFDDGSLPDVPEGPLLHYHVLGDDVVAFVVSDGQVSVRRLAGAARASAALTREWYAECDQRSSAGRDHVPAGAPDRCRLVLADLHRVLIEPVDDLLADHHGLPLLVVPHRHLFSVPFEALQGRGEPLAQRHQLSFAPGIGPGVDAVPGWRPRGEGALVVGVPDEKAPAIATEIRQVADHWPTAEILLGEEATGARLRAHAAGKGLIHLACHGSYSAGNPFFSALDLADRRVSAAELLELRIPGALVVLSACAAGQSSDTSAEPAGLGWALLAAGAGAVIASLWSVEDEVAVELMTTLHRHLADGLTPAEALDLARDEVARRWPDPYHWASFRLLCSPTEGSTP